MGEEFREKAKAFLHQELDVDDIKADKKLDKILQEMRQQQARLKTENEELHASQDDLSKSQQKYLDLFNFAPVAYFLFDTAGNILDVNTTGERYCHRTKRHLIGQPFRELLEQNSRNRFSEHLQSVFKTGTNEHCDLVLHIKRHGNYYMRVQSTKIFREDEPRILSVMSDVTELFQAREQIQYERDRFEIIINTMNDAVFLVDNHKKILTCNEAAVRLSGYFGDNIINKRLDQILNFKSPQNELPYHQTVKTGRVARTRKDIIFYSKQHRRHIVSVVSIPVIERNELNGMVVMIFDVTHLRKFERELHHTQKLESLGTLASGIAHDFNNLLTAIQGNLDLIKMINQPNEKELIFLDRAENACDRAHGLTSQLLTFAKGGQAEKCVTSLQDLIKESIDFILSGSNSKLVTEISTNLWPVEADPEQIRQVLGNLIINATQAMPEGGVIMVSARNYVNDDFDRLTLPEEHYVQIQIKDSGIGISEENLNRIFDPYFTTKKSGTGLGLATSYSIVKNHGGTIDVQSTKGKGSTFTVYLPAVQADSIKEQQKETLETDQLHGKVLIMDDEEQVRSFLSSALKLFGVTTDCVENGNQAVDNYRRAAENDEPFDLVILDLTVRGEMGGRTALEQLRDFDPQVNAIVTSGYISSDMVESFQEKGFLDIIPKPYKIGELYQIVSKHLSR